MASPSRASMASRRAAGITTRPPGPRVSLSRLARPKPGFCSGAAAKAACGASAKPRTPADRDLDSVFFRAMTGSSFAQSRTFLRFVNSTKDGKLYRFGISSRFLEKFPSDQHAPDLARASPDLVELCVAQEPARGIIVDVAIAAQQLDRVERYARGGLRSIKDRTRRILACGLVPVAGAGHGVDVSARRIERHIHIGNLRLHELERADGLAELFAFVDVRQHEIERGLHDAKRTRRQHSALIIEAGHKHVYAAANAADHVLFWHLAILEDELGRVGAAHAELVKLGRD